MLSLSIKAIKLKSVWNYVHGFFNNYWGKRVKTNKNIRFINYFHIHSFFSGHWKSWRTLIPIPTSVHCTFNIQRRMFSKIVGSVWRSFQDSSSDLYYSGYRCNPWIQGWIFKDAKYGWPGSSSQGIFWTLRHPKNCIRSRRHACQICWHASGQACPHSITKILEP